MKRRKGKPTPDAHPADQARALDRAYFRSHPTVRSYMRPHIEGECQQVPPGAAVECVAVAFVSARQTVKAIVWPGGDRKEARRDVERLAHLLRGQADRGVSA